MRLARPLAVIAIALSIHAGCFPERWSPRGHRIAYEVDGGVALLGAAMLLVPCTPSDSAYECEISKSVIGVASIAGATLGAIVNYFLSEEPFGAAEPAPARTSPVPGLDRVAVEAAAAARLGHCDVARTSLRRIFRDDRAFFDEVVAGEPALVRCLR